MTGSSAQRSMRVRRSLLPTVLSSETTAIRLPQSGMGFESFPPLAIASIPFKFLKSLGLSSVGLGLDAVPSCFGWELVVWKPMEEQFRADIEKNSAEVFREIHDVVEVREDTFEEGKIKLDMGIGDVPVHEVGGRGSIFENYQGDSFEKAGEINLEEDPQTPAEPVPSVSSVETLTSDEPRKKRVKTLAGRIDLPWVRKVLAQRSKTSPASRHLSTQTNQSSQPTRKSHQLAAQGFVRRSSTAKQGPPVVEEIESSPEGSPIKNLKTPTQPQDSPVLESEQASTETNPLSKQTSTTRPALK